MAERIILNVINALIVNIIIFNNELS